MGFVARSRRKMWFGTEEYATWIPTPNSGADSSPQAWNETGTFLGGDGYVIGSRNSHKQYVYEWPSSSTREDAQLMKSFYEGAYGRGKLYFVEPLIYDTNVLPAKWANPAITCGFEGPSLVPGVDPVELTRADVVGGFFDLVGVQEPLTGALYNLTDVPGTSATFTPVFENLFTNPRIVGDGTWAEVRRNRMRSPIAGNAANWQSNAGGGSADNQIIDDARFPGGGAVQSIQTTAGNAGWVDIGNGAPAADFSEGDTVFMSVRAEFVGQVDSSPRLVPGGSTGTRPDYAEVDRGTIENGDGTVTLWAIFVLSNLVGVVRPIISNLGSRPVGSVIRAGGSFLSKSAKYEDYFDGSTPDFTVDPDMRTRWLGEPNASESVMEIETVAGLTTMRSIAGLSSRDGTPAIRLIATSPYAQPSDAWSYAWFSVPPAARGHGTLMGTRHVPTALSPSRHDFTGLDIRDPIQDELVGVGAGEWSLRRVFSGLTANFRALLGHGGAQGSGDVYWTRVGLFEGDYSGPAFSGSDGSVTIDGIPYSTRWVGASDFSVSQAGIWTLDDNIILDDRNSVFIPIPEGMQLNIGANFQVIGLDNPGIYLKPITDTPSNDIYTVGQASRSNLFPTVIPAKNGVRGVRMWIGKLGDSGNLSVLVVNFIHARLSPIGKPPTGPSHWIGGQGHAGTRFALPPTYISNTGVGGGQISYAATFKESLI